MISENEVSQTQFSSNQTSQQNITIKQTEDKNSPQQNLSTTADVSVNRLRIKFQIAFAFLTFILLGANDAVIGVLLPHWGSSYNVDKTTLSLVFFAGTVGYLTAALNSNFLFRTLGRVKFLSLGKLAFLIGAITFCFQPPIYILLSIPPFLLGFGAAILEAALNAHLADFPNKTALLNYLHAFYGLGALLTPFIASQMLEADLSWGLTYLVISSGSLVLLISIRWLFTKADQGLTPTATSSENTQIESPLQYRFVWLFAFFSLLYAGAEISLGNWSYSFLTQYRDEGPVLAGWLMSGYWLGLTVGRVFIAPLTNKLGSRKVVNLCLIGVIGGVFILNFLTFSATSAFGLLLTGFCLGPINPTALAFLTNVIPPHLVTGAISFIASLGSLGKAFFPWVAGNVAEKLGLEMFLPYIIVIIAVMVVSWIVVLNQANHNQMEIQPATE
ncbi:MAG: sugar MFS transporter [Halothece sp.]